MIKRNNMKMTALSMALGLAVLTGCSSDVMEQTNNSGSSSTVEAQSMSTTVTAQSGNVEVSYKENDYYTEWNQEEVTQITLSGSSISAQDSGAVINGTTVTINSGGTYVISGQLSDGQIIVDSADDQVVRLVLNGAELHCETGAPIYVKQAKKVVLSLEAESNNKLSDGTQYVLEEGSDEPDATLFCKDDLTINGAGSLTIEANYNNAITSKDKLKIMEGTINITAVGDGIKGKDMVAIKSGNLTIKATEDGIKSTNSTDSTKGFIYIEDGNFDITSGNDGFQAETDIKILDGEFKLNTGGGSVNGASHVESMGGGFGGGKPDFTEGTTGTRPNKEGLTRPTDEGMTKPADEGMTMPEDAGMMKPEDEGAVAPPAGNVAGTNDTANSTTPVPGATSETSTSEKTTSTEADTVAEETSDSYKGIKAANTMIIDGGVFDIDSADDALHTNNSIIINEGEFTILSGDDGIHADTSLAINGGSININKCYEGLEAADITVAGGKTYITSSDDGVNATEGTSEATMAAGPGASAGKAKLTISGGYLNVDASGDGLDSNGAIYMTGGTTIVNGPTNGGNGALDYDSTFEVSGGTLIAAGSAQMAQATTSTSTQKTVVMTFTNAQEANSTVALLDESGNLVMSFAPSKAYQSVIVSSPLLEEGKTYSFTYGGTVSGTGTDGLYEAGSYTGGTKVADFTISDAITYLSESGVTTGGNGFGQGGGMKPSGGQGGRGNRGTQGTEQETSSQTNSTI